MDHLLAVAFDTEGAARAALGNLHDRGTEADVSDVCIASRGQDGRIDVAVADGGRVLGADLWQRLVHSLAREDAATGLPVDFTQQVAESLQPGGAALFALTNGADLDPLVARLGDGGRPLRCELGDGGRDELRRRIEALPDDPRAADPMVWQAGFGSFQ
jgi:uncharacterized membrane protein